MPPETIAPEALSDFRSSLLPEVPPPDVQAQLQQVRTLRQSVVLWLLALGLAGFTLTLLLVVATLQDDLAQTEAQLQSIQRAVEALRLPSSKAQALTTTLSETLALAAALETVRPPLGIDWPAVMSQVGNYSSAEMAITDLVQENNRLTLTGEALDSTVVTRYQSRLEAVPIFSRVVIQSIKVIERAPGSSAATPALPASPMTVAFVIIMELNL